ncbi:MAG TPA: S-layer homology domain-containing protein [Thermoanaerobaculia bacterium]|nr:S-layer homology domain-containing protein [Thermoanaerobaculia bacterium]
MSSRRTLVLAAVLFAAASLARAQSAPAWGTGALSSEVVSAWDMQALGSDVTWSGDVNTGYRYSTTPGYFMAALHLPQGAVIQYIELKACDSTTFDSVQAGIQRLGSTGGTIFAAVSTGTTEASGCSRWRSDLPVPETVDTQTYDYLAFAQNTGTDGLTSIGSLRVYYQLQVSPAPASATFNDVGTNHPYFQFVEALAASGITAGCGGGNFCPDNPLTRGQMAVFLAKALGLHWPVASESMLKR